MMNDDDIDRMHTIDMCNICYHKPVPNSLNENESERNVDVVIMFLYYVLQKHDPTKSCIYLHPYYNISLHFLKFRL